jgi:hypothetical protein
LLLNDVNQFVNELTDEALAFLHALAMARPDPRTTPRSAHWSALARLKTGQNLT